jgi:hypothetical protein
MTQLREERERKRERGSLEGGKERGKETRSEGKRKRNIFASLHTHTLPAIVKMEIETGAFFFCSKINTEKERENRTAGCVSPPVANGCGRFFTSPAPQRQRRGPRLPSSPLPQRSSSPRRSRWPTRPEPQTRCAPPSTWQGPWARARGRLPWPRRGRLRERLFEFFSPRGGEVEVEIEGWSLGETEEEKSRR